MYSEHHPTDYPGHTPEGHAAKPEISEHRATLRALPLAEILTMGESATRDLGPLSRKIFVGLGLVAAAREAIAAAEAGGDLRRLETVRLELADAVDMCAEGTMEIHDMVEGLRRKVRAEAALGVLVEILAPRRHFDA